VGEDRRVRGSPSEICSPASRHGFADDELAGPRQFPVDHRGRAEVSSEALVIDGEVVVLGKEGISDFDALHSRQYDKRA
jgi:hypothetical protein